MGRILVLVLSFLVTGCGSSMVSTRGDSVSAFAPSNEAARRGGTVKYNNGGPTKGKRASAYKRMSKRCGGPYRIVNEGPVVEGAYTYWYIHFDCD